MIPLGSHKLIAFRTRSLNDQERDPFARARRVQFEVSQGHYAGLFALPPRDWPLARLQEPGRFVVRFTRFAPGGTPLDDDNLIGGLKAPRDGVAKRLGIDDGDVARLRFEYRQERGPWGLLVEVFREQLVPQTSAASAQSSAGAAEEAS